MSSAKKRTSAESLPKVEVLPEDLNLAVAKPKKDLSHLKAYQFPKGVSGNPGGKQAGVRNTLQKSFLTALSADFDKNGVNTINRARKKDPMGMVKIYASLLPKQVEKTMPLEEMNDAELAAAIELLKSHQSVADSGQASQEVGTGESTSSESKKA